jgi:arylsulfatase A-like enzyme
LVGRFADGWAPPPKPAHSLGYRHSDDFLNQKRQEYDEYLAYADSEFGRLYDFMEQSGVLDNTYVVVTSDHGEMFERGILGHITPVLYDPVIRIPLLISRPGQQERQDILTPTLSVDLLPTLLHATGRPMPDWIEGSLLPAFGGDEENGARSFFVVEAKQNAKYAPLTKGAVALIRGRHKLIRYLGDPEELENLYPAGPPLAPEMVDELDEKLREVNQPWTRGGSRKRAPTIYRS